MASPPMSTDDLPLFDVSTHDLHKLANGAIESDGDHEFCQRLFKSIVKWHEKQEDRKVGRSGRGKRGGGLKPFEFLLVIWGEFCINGLARRAKLGYICRYIRYEAQLTSSFTPHFIPPLPPPIQPPPLTKDHTSAIPRQIQEKYRSSVYSGAERNTSDTPSPCA